MAVLWNCNDGGISHVFPHDYELEWFWIDVDHHVILTYLKYGFSEKVIMQLHQRSDEIESDERQIFETLLCV